MKKFSTELKWGAIFAISVLVWTIFEKLMGWHDEHIADHGKYTMIFALVAFAIYVLALRDKRDRDYDGIMTWKEGLISGFLVSLVVMVLTPIVQYLTHTVISPDYFTNAINSAVSNEYSTQEQAEAFYNLKSYIMMDTISAPSMGIVTSAIVALFVRTKRG